MKICKDAAIGGNPADISAQKQAELEYATLTRHLQMAIEAGNDQVKLEQVVQSLEKNLAVRYQRWREMSTI